METKTETVAVVKPNSVIGAILALKTVAQRSERILDLSQEARLTALIEMDEIPTSVDLTELERQQLTNMLAVADPNVPILALVNDDGNFAVQDAATVQNDAEEKALDKALAQEEQADFEEQEKEEDNEARDLIDEML